MCLAHESCGGKHARLANESIFTKRLQVRCSMYYWSMGLLENHYSFLFSFSLFKNRNRMNVCLLYFGSSQLVCSHRFTAGDEILSPDKSHLVFCYISTKEAEMIFFKLFSIITFLFYYFLIPVPLTI